MQLDPCPFCGGEAEIAGLKPHLFVRCQCCGCEGPVFQTMPDEAITAWNRRAPSPSPAPGVVAEPFSLENIIDRVIEAELDDALSNCDGGAPSIEKQKALTKEKVDARTALEAALASLSQSAKGERGTKLPSADGPMAAGGATIVERGTQTGEAASANLPTPANPAQGVSEAVNYLRDAVTVGLPEKEIVRRAGLVVAAIGAGGQAVAVKPMEWVDADEGMCTKWRAAALGGHYELVDFGKDDPGFAVNFHWGRPLSFWFIQGEPDELGPTGPKIFPTLKAAKAAAQADYERRIMSALSQPHPADERVVEALYNAKVLLKALTGPDDAIAQATLAGIDAALAKEGRND